MSLRNTHPQLMWKQGYPLWNEIGGGYPPNMSFFFKDFKDVFQRKEIIFFYPKQQGVYFDFFVDAMNYEPSTFKQARTSHIYEAKQMDIFQ